MIYPFAPTVNHLSQFAPQENQSGSGGTPRGVVSGLVTGKGDVVTGGILPVL